MLYKPNTLGYMPNNLLKQKTDTLKAYKDTLPNLDALRPATNPYKAVDMAFKPYEIKTPEFKMDWEKAAMQSGMYANSMASNFKNTQPFKLYDDKGKYTGGVGSKLATKLEGQGVSQADISSGFNQAAGAAAGLGLAGADILGANLQKDPAKQMKTVAGGYLSGAAKGIGMAMPLGTALAGVTGGLSVPIAAAAGALAGGITGAVKANKTHKNFLEQQEELKKYNTQLARLKSQNVDMLKSQQLLASAANMPQRTFLAKKGGLIKYAPIPDLNEHLDLAVDLLTITEDKPNITLQEAPVVTLRRGGSYAPEQEQQLRKLAVIVQNLEKGVDMSSLAASLEMEDEELDEIVNYLETDKEALKAVHTYLYKQENKNKPRKANLPSYTSFKRQQEFKKALPKMGAVSFKKAGGKIKSCKDGCSCSPCSKKAVKRIATLFKRGGVMDLEKENVILDGVSHDEFNNTGVPNDRGLPVVNSQGIKVAEFESLEMVMQKEHADKIAELVKKAKSGDKKAKEELGFYVKEQLEKNTYDYANLIEDVVRSSN